MSKMNKNKALDPHGLSPEIMRELYISNKEVQCILNKCLRDGYFSKAWKVSQVTFEKAK